MSAEAVLRVIAHCFCGHIDKEHQFEDGCVPADGTWCGCWRDFSDVVHNARQPVGCKGTCTRPGIFTGAGHGLSAAAECTAVETGFSIESIQRTKRWCSCVCHQRRVSA